jgi:lysophospholipid acyltransferase (LPLAT)-like uncharacterized protein
MPGVNYDSPTTFTRTQRLQLAVLPPLIAGSFKSLAGTNRLEVRNAHHFNDTQAQHGHLLLAVWHESTGLLLYRYHNMNFHAPTSYSFDGELATRIAGHFGTESVRGSSSRGGSHALAQLQRAAEIVPYVGITVDGPRGPRREVKPGIAVLAARTQLPIVANACTATRAWRMRSWDRFMIPKPFGTIICDYAPPIPPPPDDSPESVEATRLEVERTLNALQEKLEQEMGLP